MHILRKTVQIPEAFWFLEPAIKTLRQNMAVEPTPSSENYLGRTAKQSNE